MARKRGNSEGSIYQRKDGAWVADVHMTSHDLRHAHASYLIDSGVPITVVSAVLGHSNASITMAVYAHKLKGSHEQVAAIMDGLVGEKG